MTVLINNVKYDVPGVSTTCVDEDPTRLTLDSHCYRRRVPATGETPLAFVAHTIHGVLPKPPSVTPGAGSANREYLVVKNWNRGAAGNPPRSASAHFVVGYDGHVVNPLDLALVASYSVGTVPRGSKVLADRVNGWTISLEMCQLADGRVYQATLDATAALFDWLAGHFGIPRVYPGDASAEWNTHELARQTLLDHRGVFGHRNCKPSNRGVGDPGPPIFNVLQVKGWAAWQIDRDELADDREG